MEELTNFSDIILNKWKDENRYTPISKEDSNIINQRLSSAMMKSKRVAEQKQVSSRISSAKIILNS